MSEPAHAKRAFWPLLGSIAALVLLTQALSLRASLDANPFATTLLMDADVYWQWGAAIARGELLGETPFLSAPLYPYLLGALRALGLELYGVLAFQSLLYTATGVLLALVARREFGPGIGLLTAILFFAVSDPAFYTGRILNCTLAVFLTTVAIALAQALSNGPSLARCAIFGASLGILALAHPPVLIVIPLFAVWSAWTSASGRVPRALLTLAGGALVILPATVHNQSVSGEWIPISAQAGITFYHGNQPGADGTYSAAQGVSTDRAQQNLDAIERARRVTGDESWKATSRYYFGLGLEYWRSDPLQAALLSLRKVYWFLSGNVYGDIYLPSFEREDGLPTTSGWSPLPLGLLTWPGFVALVIALRRSRRFIPWLVLGILPLLIVGAFWYSPRYRIPALPPIALGVGYALHSLRAWRTQKPTAIAVVLALTAAVVSLLLNPLRGFDAPQTYRGQYDYTVGTLHMRRSELPEARERFERARAAGNPVAGVVLGDLKRVEGDLAGAIADLEVAVEALPNDAFAHRSLGTALAVAGQNERARTEFERALELDPNNWQAIANLGNVLRALGDTPAAIVQYERAIALNPDFGDARYNLAVTLTQNVSPPQFDQARAQLQEALRRDPANGHYRLLLEQIEAR